MLVSDTTLTFGTQFKRFDLQRFLRRLRAAKAKQRTLRSQSFVLLPGAGRAGQQGLSKEVSLPNVFESRPGESSNTNAHFNESLNETINETLDVDPKEWPVPPSMKKVVEIVPDLTGKGREVHSCRVVYNDGQCVKCWHCGYDLPAESDGPDAWGGYPVVLRMDRVANRFLTKGHFCTPSCALGSLRSLNGTRNAAALTRYFYRLRYGISEREVIFPSPPKHCLRDYGGHMTIEEYRKAGWARGNEPVMRALDLPRPLTHAYEIPRADIVIYGPEGAPKPQLWKAQPLYNGSSFARRQAFLRRQQEYKLRPTEMGRATYKDKNGKRRFMSHWSQKDADRKAAQEAADARALADLQSALQACPSGGPSTGPLSTQTPMPPLPPPPKKNTTSTIRNFL